MNLATYGTLTSDANNTNNNNTNTNNNMISDNDRLLVMNLLGYIFKKQQKYDLSELLITQCVQECNTIYNSDDERTIEYTYNLADLYYIIEEYNISETLYNTLIQTIRHKYTLLNQSPVYLLYTILASLANMYTRRGQFSKAEPLFREVHVRIYHIKNYNTLSYTYT